MGYVILFTKGAEKEKKDILSNKLLKEKVAKVLKQLSEDPFAPNQRFESLVGNLKGYYSRAVDIKNRVVYKVDEENMQVIVYTLWKHYEQF